MNARIITTNAFGIPNFADIIVIAICIGFAVAMLYNNTQWGLIVDSISVIATSRPTRAKFRATLNPFLL
jgi:hypothetical protein